MIQQSISIHLLLTPHPRLHSNSLSVGIHHSQAWQNVTVRARQPKHSACTHDYAGPPAISVFCNKITAPLSMQPGWLLDKSFIICAFPYLAAPLLPIYTYGGQKLGSRLHSVNCPFRMSLKHFLKQGHVIWFEALNHHTGITWAFACWLSKPRVKFIACYYHHRHTVNGHTGHYH